MIQKTVATFVATSLNPSQICKTLNHAKQLHAHLLTTHHNIDPLFAFLVTSKKPSFFSYGCSIFQHHSSHRNVFMYNTMVRGFVQMQLPSSAVLCYIEMLRDGILANKYTFPPLLKASSMLFPCQETGHLVHGHVVKVGICTDVFVGSAMIEFYSRFTDMGSARKLFDEMPVKDVVLFTTMVDGYGKVGDVENAMKVFEEMPERNSVSWSAIMAAFSGVSDFREVLRLFRRMQEGNVRPNESGLVTVLTACAHLGALVQGLWIHNYAKRHSYDSNPILATALVDMYSRCGYMEAALSVFKDMPTKDVGAWNSIISGFAMNGNPRKSLELFNNMCSSGIHPNETTFITILTACTHAKLVNEGLKLFDQMSTIYKVVPKLEHYSCVVDLLARSGMVEEAEEFIDKRMGGFDRVDANVWGALLGACRVYGRVDIGNRVSKKLASMGVKDVGAHVLSYSIYKEAGWETEAKHSRRLIEDLSLKKKPGCSMVEVDGVNEEFLAGDLSHPKALEMCRVLNSWSNMLVIRADFVPSAPRDSLTARDADEASSKSKPEQRADGGITTL